LGCRGCSDKIDAMSNDVYIVDGTRSPFAKSGSDLKKVHAAELGKQTLSALMKNFDFSKKEWGKICDEVIVGNTGTPSDAANIARIIALRAGLPEKIPAYTVHRNCASALESLAQASLKLSAGESDVIFAGGSESMSQMPLLYNKKAVSFFEKLSRAKSIGAKLSQLKNLPIKDFLNPRIAIMEGLTDPVCSVNMGQTAETLAKEFKISREEQDAFALASHQKAVFAQEKGYFKDEISAFAIPPDYEVLENDVGPRKGQSMKALAKLKPYFDRSRFGSVTPGNACPLTDGAAMMLLANEAGLKKLGNPKVLAKVTGWAFAGLDPSRMGLGPVFATEKLLRKTNQKLSDFDLIELNEAFAAQVMACQKAFESEEFCQKNFNSPAIGKVSDDRLNQRGGAIALGHPVGATGTRLVLTLVRELIRSGRKKGLATLCIGGGQGGAMSVEIV